MIMEIKTPLNFCRSGRANCVSVSHRAPLAARRSGRTFGRKANMKSKLATIWLTLGAVALTGCAPQQPQSPQAELKLPAEIKKGSDEDLISRWKVQRVAIADVEAAKTKFDKPSGKEWEKFKTTIQTGDEVWYFCSPRETWQQLAGWRGYAIFRGGRFVGCYTTAEN